MKSYFLLAACVIAMPLAAQVKLAEANGRVKIDIDGKPYAEFVLNDPAAPKPYLYPLRAASGTLVTRKFPMEKVEGEVYDHPHHRGLWFTHGEVNGYDFWMNEVGQKTKTKPGKITLNKVNAIKSGAKQGSVTATWTWEGGQGEKLLTEQRTMTFHSDPKLRIIDIDILLTAITETKFGDTKEGTFAIRMATSMDEKHGGKMVSAEGAVGEKAIWGKASPWVDYVGKVGDETLGVAIFDHPKNPRYPTRWHARSYGLFAANIFGLHDFENDKTKDGSLTLKKGESVRFRYRVVIHPGDTEQAKVAELYKAWNK